VVVHVVDASFLLSILKAGLESYLKILNPLVITDLVWEEIRYQKAQAENLPLKLVEISDVKEV